MSYRQRAQNYTKDTFSSRLRSQPDIFNERKKMSSYPTEHSQIVSSISNEGAQIIKAEKEIQNDQDGDVVDRESFKPSADTGKTRPNAKSTSTMPVITTVAELKSSFVKAWTTVDRILMTPLELHQPSYFTPSSIAYMKILFNMELLLAENEDLEWDHPFYFSLPVRLYYIVLFYVQVYRSKSAAGKITKSESSWLRNFERKYKDTSLPIAGPIFPIVSNIAANSPDDAQFSFVYPDVPIDGTYSTKPNADKNGTTLTIKSQHFLLPSVPLIADMLRQFCNLKGDEIEEHFNDSDEYVPFDLSKGGNLGGIIFPPQTSSQTMGSQFAQILHNPAITNPLPEGKSRLAQIQSYWSRTICTDIPEIRTDTEFIPNGPSDFTMLGEELDWFQICVDYASIQAKYFSHASNLSNVQPIGGQSVVVQAFVTLESSDVPTSLPSWYPTTFENLRASFRSTTSVLTPDHAFNAAYSLTCCKLNWKDPNGHLIGSKLSNLKRGPYWENSKYNYLLKNPELVLNQPYFMIQSQFYNSKADK